jgi:hypothetical protein
MKPTDDEITSQQEYGMENVELGGIAVEARIEKGERSRICEIKIYTKPTLGSRLERRVYQLRLRIAKESVAFVKFTDHLSLWIRVIHV